MSVNRIAGRYAQSLIDLAQEQNNLDEVYKDMALFAKVSENRDFELMLKSPIIKGEKKQSIFDAIFKDKVSKLSTAFFGIVIRKNREQYLDAIAKEFVRQYQVIKKISTVTIITATKLGDATIETIKNQLIATGNVSKNVELTTEVDESIIGGFKLVYDNNLYDASAASKLEELKREFSKNTYIKNF